MLNVEVSGDPRHPAVIITHGVTDNAHSQADLVRRLNPYFQVFAVDTLGHGVSPRFTDDDLQDPFAAASDALHETVREILAYRASVGALKGGLIGHGHSMGGALLSHVARKDPAAFRFLILEDPAWLAPEQYAEYVARGPEMADKYDEWTANPESIMASNRADRPHWPVEELPGWLSGKMQVDRRLIRTGVVTFSEPWQDVARELRVPTYVISSNDPDTIADHEQVAQLGNPYLHVRLIAGAPHCVRRENTGVYHAIMTEIFAEQGLDIAGDQLKIPGDRQPGAIDDRLRPIIDKTPPQTPWNLTAMRANPGEPDPRFAPDSVTASGARIFEPRPDVARAVTVVSIHGGGYVAGHAFQSDERNRALANLGFRVISPDYRLAPEHPYPAGLDDVVADIAANASDEALILLGDSAGAGLAWSALERYPGRVDAVALLEPCLDPVLASRSFATYADGPIWTRDAASSAMGLYAGRTPSVAEVSAVRPLPHALVVVNPVDPLRDEGIRLALDLVDAGGEVEMHMLNASFHGAMNAPEIAPQIDAWLIALAERITR